MAITYQNNFMALISWFLLAYISHTSQLRRFLTITHPRMVTEMFENLEAIMSFNLLYLRIWFYLFYSSIMVWDYFRPFIFIGCWLHWIRYPNSIVLRPRCWSSKDSSFSIWMMSWAELSSSKACWRWYSTSLQFLQLSSSLLLVLLELLEDITEQLFGTICTSVILASVLSICYWLLCSPRRTNTSRLQYKCTKQCSITLQTTIFIVTAVRMSASTLKPNKWMENYEGPTFKTQGPDRIWGSSSDKMSTWSPVYRVHSWPLSSI